MKNHDHLLASTGANLEHAHLLNQRVVLEAVRLHEPVSRAKLASLTALTQQTVFNIMAGLERSGLIHALGHESGKRGQPAKLFGINAEGAFSIGINLERDHVTAVLIDLTGAVLTRVRQPRHYSTAQDALKDTYNDVLNAIRALRRQATRKRIWGVGVAVPGSIDLRKDGVSYAPNFDGLEQAEFQEFLQKKTGLRVLVDNEAIAAAIGESWYGAARGLQVFCYLYLGVEVEGGVVIDGRPFRGFRGNAGEVGHVVVDRSTAAKQCVCGKKGCLTTYLSLNSLDTRLRKAGVTYTDPSELEKLLESRNGVLLSWLKAAAVHLANAIENLQLLFDPEAFVIGGPLPGTLLTYLSKRCLSDLGERARSKWSDPPRVLLGSLENEAAARGAAALLIADVIAPNYEGITEGKYLSLVESS